MVRRRAMEMLEGGLSSREVGRFLGVDPGSVAGWAHAAGMELQRGRRGGLVGVACGQQADEPG